MQQTLVLHVNPEQPEAAPIARAAAVLRAGGLVAFPTETVYGLGANALDDNAVRAIFRAKDRPAYDPLIVHLADAASLPSVVRVVPDAVRLLAVHFWPGPLTLVLPRNAAVPPSVTAAGDTVAVRIPSHPVALALIRAAGVPVAAPSANRFGRISPTCVEHVLADLQGRVDIILDGGPTPVGVESTVLSLVSSIPAILRPGGVSREALAAVLGEVDVHQLAITPEPESMQISPGTSSSHYAPRARLILYRGQKPALLQAMRAEADRLQSEGERVGVLAADEDAGYFAALRERQTSPVCFQPVGSEQCLTDVARRLYGALHALDQAGVTVILARDFGNAGLGLAVRDRLTRAAGGRVIQV
ncbi:MAG: threonylcarbamoyl-AMP synthase [Anaerolineae bacterium]|nr:threonylcarbamoyl-AMP synthase [Anaerolineae bacterium]